NHRCTSCCSAGGGGSRNCSPCPRSSARRKSMPRSSRLTRRRRAMPEPVRDEQDLLIEGLPLDASDHGWAEWERRVLGGTDECPPVLCLIRWRRGELPP